MTARVHKKCCFWDPYFSKCKRTGILKMPWDDACPDYVLKPELDYNPGMWTNLDK